MVASEVRALAQRGAGAALEIEELIETSVNKVESGSRLADEARGSMTGIVDQVRQVSTPIAEISTAGEEQTQGISQIGAAVNELDMVVQRNSVVQQNSRAVNESSAAAEQLRAEAQVLNEAVSIFGIAA